MAAEPANDVWMRVPLHTEDDAAGANAVAGIGWEWRYESSSNTVNLYERGRWRFDIDMDRVDWSSPRSIVDMIGYASEHAGMLDDARLGGLVRLLAGRSTHFHAVRFRVVQPTSSAGFEVVYVLRVGKLIKIGTTTSLARRLSQYPPDTKLLLVLPGGESEERKLLDRFAAHLAHGREWFKPNPEIAAFVRENGGAA